MPPENCQYRLTNTSKAETDTLQCIYTKHIINTHKTWKHGSAEHSYFS